MTPIGIQRIEKRLEVFDGLIDMADVENRPPAQKRPHFFSRALAAYCVKILGGTSLGINPDKLCAAIEAVFGHTPTLAIAERQ